MQQIPPFHIEDWSKETVESWYILGTNSVAGVLEHY